MSFVLQIFDRIVASDVRSAAAACQRDVPLSPRVAAMFDRFLREVQDYYPLGDTAKAAGRPLIWTEGLPFGPIDTSPLNLGVDVHLLDDTVLGTLAHVAADAGLQMFEPQGGALYRLDRQVVYDDGRTEAFAERARVLPPMAPSRPAFDPTSAAPTLDAICDAVMARVGSHGFTVVPHPTRTTTRLVQRRYGPALQSFCFQVQPDHDRQSVHTSVNWDLPEVREAWLHRLDRLGGPELRDRITPRFMPEHEMLLTSFPGAQRPPLSNNTLRTQEDVQTYADALAQWCEDRGLPYQSQTKDLAGIGKALLSAKALGTLLADGEYGSGLLYLDMQMSRLVLALACKTPLRAVWIEALRYRQRATQARHWEPVTGDDGHEMFERILASLRDEPPQLPA